MSQESVEQAIQRCGGAVALLRNSPIRPHTFPVAAEFTNWRTEQRAWRESVALLDQSHHMTDLYIEGPDALRLLSDLGVNSFARFGPGHAKQYVAVNHDGQLIGDAVLFHLEENRFDLVGHPMVLDWVQYHLETGEYDATTERDDNSYDREAGRPPRVYRYEVQGPNAVGLLERVTGAPVPPVGFFRMTTFTIAGRQVRALRHGMAGQPGFELFGPWEEGAEVLAAVLAAGSEFGLVRAGAKAYSTANLESAWVPAPFPAVFSGDRLKGYREWLPTSAMGSLGGSMDSEDVTDYYVTPYDIGYGGIVAFDHDFVGREALEEIAKNPRRTKVTLVWNAEDVAAAVGSLHRSGELPAKYIEFPKARYALHQSDKVLAGGELVGISMDVGYTANERAMVSLATVDLAHSEPGTEVTVVWGESPNSAKPGVEAHRQVEIRATVAPAPFVGFARGAYRDR
ncbi:aminomethyl transferase family protein [Streptomyces sp. NPDC008092]|uniref:aminomethyl transferase family protein n=1 Tax=Streptomyces sp. NPDC008092 TaxID=3364808 RepID=UPI0036E14518